MGTRRLKICMFVDEKGGTSSEGNITPHQGYLNMKDWLTMYVANCDIVTGIRPFQLGYRNFDAYILDTGGYPEHTQRAFMTSVGNIVRGRGSRLYLFWTGESWDAFCDANPDLRGHDTCVNCCEIGALEKIEKILLDTVG